MLGSDSATLASRWGVETSTSIPVGANKRLRMTFPVKADDMRAERNLILWERFLATLPT